MDSIVNPEVGDSSLHSNTAYLALPGLHRICFSYALVWATCMSTGEAD